MNRIFSFSSIPIKVFVVGATILFTVLAVVSLIASASTSDNWTSNLYLNFGTGMLGSVITYVVISVVIGSREAQERYIEQKEMISEILKTELRNILEKRPDLEVSEGDLSIVERRLNRITTLFKGLRMLWIDDVPSNNQYESNILQQLGVTVDVAQTSEEAASKLDSRRYDFVISDMGRAHNYNEGMDFLLLRERQGKPLPPTVFYVDKIRYTENTARAFGNTNRPDDLFHLVMDIVERIRV